MLSIQPRTSSAGGKTREQVIGEIAVSIQSKVPPMFALDEVAEKFPTDYNESMNTVLTQEDWINKYLESISRRSRDV